VTISEAVKALNSDGTGLRIGRTRVRMLITAGRIPAYKDPTTGQWVVTEAKILPIPQRTP